MSNFFVQNRRNIHYVAKSDGIFCRIISREIPLFKLYEDERSYGMMDINPFQDGHCLVLTKTHCVIFLDANPADFAAILPAAQRMPVP